MYVYMRMCICVHVHIIYDSVVGQPISSRVMGAGGVGQRMPNSQVMMSGNRPNVESLLAALKQSPNPQHRQQLMEIMRKNPEIMASIIKQKDHQGQQQPQGAPPPNMGGPPQPGPHVRPMHPGQHQDVYYQRQGRPPVMGSNMYQQPGMPPNTAYQHPMQSRPMPPHPMPQYSGGQPRYAGPGNDMMSRSPGVMGHQQQMRAPAGMHPSHMLQQTVKSPPPVSHPQHACSPQPMPSPRQQSTASPATLMQQQQADPMGAMMGGQGQPGYSPMVSNSSMQQGDFDQSSFGNQSSLQQHQQQDSLDKFVQNL